jgi:hypothetical protein
MDSDFRPVKRPVRPSPSDTVPTPKPPLHSQTFHTPEEVAAVDDITTSAPLTELPAQADDHPSAKKPTSWRDKLRLHWPPGQKEWLASVVIVVVCGSIIGFVLTHTGPKPVASAIKITKPKAPPKPTTVPSTLSGLPVDPSVNKRPVTGVMIENTTFARPQSGLGQAGVVFEAIAEGGVTRFLALFQDTAPANIGPVRSARPYYIQWDTGFDAAYAHVGGSPDGLADIKAWGVKDLDEFHNAGAYHRISSRVAPHNMYTSIAALNQLEASKGYTTSNFTGFPRKPEAPSKTPNARSVNLTLSGPIYNAHYDYNAGTNSYNRSEGGAPHIDANTNQQISPKVVVAMVVPMTQGTLDSSGAYYSNYASVGSGAVYVFQDGLVTTGQWSKSSNTAQITFTDANGQPLKLNPGQTWITAVIANNDVSYAP